MIHLLFQFTRSTRSGLPNTEFIFIHANSMADDGLGPAMIDTDTIGVFTPSQFGLTYCDEVQVIPFSYDLSQVRELVDSLLFCLLFGTFNYLL